MTPASTEPVLGQRALNRALLARQHLIERRPASAAAEIEHLVGMQAQIPQAPYVGLWSRLEGFHPAQLSSLIEKRKAVRLGLMRNTLHLVSAPDCLRLWPLFQPVLSARFRSSSFARGLKGADFEAIVGAATELLAEKPQTLSALGSALQQRFPDHSATDLAYAIRHLTPLIQLPPRGLWGRSGVPTWSTAELWLGNGTTNSASLDTVVLRYLAAFGPASRADAAAWSGLPGLAMVVDRLRPQLRSFRDERGRQLFDLPEAPRPDPKMPVPPRFLPAYDNLLLGHRDRTRVIAFEHRYIVGGGTFLLDGAVAGSWTVTSQKNQRRLTIASFQPLKRRDRSALGEEAERFQQFLSPSARPGIAFTVAAPPAGPPR